MKKTLSLIAFLAVMGMATAPAQAATHYVSGFGGVSWMNNLEVTAANSSDDYSSNVDLGSGLTLLGAIGCDYGSYRVEGELGYQTNNLKSEVDTDAGVVGDSYAMQGDVSLLSLMANGYYDFDLGSKVELYATAGVGVAQVTFDGIADADNVPGQDNIYTTHETTMAWQVGAGLAAPIADNVKLDLRYRYFATTDFTTDYDSNWWSTNSGANTNVSSHSVLLGLRVDF